MPRWTESEDQLLWKAIKAGEGNSERLQDILQGRKKGSIRARIRTLKDRSQFTGSIDAQEVTVLRRHKPPAPEAYDHYNFPETPAIIKQAIAALPHSLKYTNGVCYLEGKRATIGQAITAANQHLKAQRKPQIGKLGVWV